MRRRFLAVCLALLVPLAATAADNETAPAPVSTDHELFPAMSATTVAVGSVLAISAAAPFDRKIRDYYYPGRNGPTAKHMRSFGDIGQVAGPIIGTGFLLQGLAFDNQKSKDTAILSYESFLVAGGATGVIKFVVGRKRPSTTSEPFSFHPAGGDASFPSGHTTTAFAAATVFSEQYPHWYVVIPSYAAAGAVGLSRLYANQHWASDVVAGAIVGTVTSHLLRSHLRHRKGESAWHLEPNLSGVKLVRTFGGN